MASGSNCFKFVHARFLYSSLGICRANCENVVSLDADSIRLNTGEGTERCIEVAFGAFLEREHRPPPLARPSHKLITESVDPIL